MALQGFTPAPMQAAGPGWDYQTELEPSETRQLIALDLPTQLPEGARISLDYTPWADTVQYNVSRWRMHSMPAAALEPELPDPLRMRALLLPQGYNPVSYTHLDVYKRQTGHHAAGRTQLQQ